MRRQCRLCGTKSNDDDNAVLRRCPPEVIDLLPFEVSWAIPGVRYRLLREVTSQLEYDVIKRQGVSNVLEKLSISGSLNVERRISSYYSSAQVWFRQLEELVGDVAWAALSEDKQHMLAEQRAEYLLYRDKENKVVPFGDVFSLKGFGLHYPSLQVVQRELLVVFEQRRLFREAELCRFGAENVISIDVFKRNGQWMASVVDCEMVRLIGECVVGSNSVRGAANMLAAIGRRENMNAMICMIDDVQHTARDPQGTTGSLFIMGCLSTIQWVGQDRFHAVHDFSKFMLPSAPFYHQTLIDLRAASVVIDASAREAILSGMMMGSITKRCTFKGREFSTSDLADLNEQERRTLITEWEISGVLHEMFSKTPCLLPEVMVDKATLKWKLDQFQEATRSRIWDSRGNPLHPGKLLFASQTAFDDKMKNLEKRLACCIPPPELAYLSKKIIGEYQGYPVYRSLLHSCGNESWHSLTSDFVTTENPSKELKTSLYYEGNSARNNQITVDANEAPRSGHRQPWEALRSNEYAGHGEVKLTRMVAVAPHPALPKLVAPAEGEVILQPVASFAAKSGKGGNSIKHIPLKSLLATGALPLPRLSQGTHLRLGLQVNSPRPFPPPFPLSLFPLSLLHSPPVLFPSSLIPLESYSPRLLPLLVQTASSSQPTSSSASSQQQASSSQSTSSSQPASSSAPSQQQASSSQSASSSQQQAASSQSASSSQPASSSSSQSQSSQPGGAQVRVIEWNNPQLIKAMMDEEMYNGDFVGQGMTKKEALAALDARRQFLQSHGVWDSTLTVENNRQKLAALRQERSVQLQAEQLQADAEGRRRQAYVENLVRQLKQSQQGQADVQRPQQQQVCGART